MDVLVAAATPWGVAALAVIRLSGPGLDHVLREAVRGVGGGLPPPGRPRRVWVVDADGNAIDDGVLVWREDDRTFTGEPTAELTVHGNPVLVHAILDVLQDAGARMARPGAFTRRAWMNGKLDLVQAEAVQQVIHAPTLQGARLARQGLEGRLSAALSELRAGLMTAVAELEARLDYPGDDLAIEDDVRVVQRLRDVAGRARALAQTHAAARVRVHGARVALVGAVNAGKSSLFNRLLGRERALVHERPGTTRDVVEATGRFGELSVTLLDTAGERETDDPIEAAGLALARDLVADVDALIVVLRADKVGPTPVEEDILARTVDRPRLVVMNGVDRAHRPVAGALPTSALTGEGVDAVADALVALLTQGSPRASDLAIASRRQRDRLLEVHRACVGAIEGLELAGVVVAADVAMEGLEALDELTGADTRDEVLDALFSRFCIGK